MLVLITKGQLESLWKNWRDGKREMCKEKETRGGLFSGPALWGEGLEGRVAGGRVE